MSNIPILFILFRRLCIVSWGVANGFGALHNLLGLYIICRGLSAALHSLHVGALYNILMYPHPNLPTPLPIPRAPRRIGPRRCGRSPPSPKGIYLSLYIYTYIYVHIEREKEMYMCCALLPPRCVFVQTSRILLCMLSHVLKSSLTDASNTMSKVVWLSSLQHFLICLLSDSSIHVEYILGLPCWAKLLNKWVHKCLLGVCMCSKRCVSCKNLVK